MYLCSILAAGGRPSTARAHHARPRRRRSWSATSPAPTPSVPGLAIGLLCVAVGSGGARRPRA
ncbi:hypothetical protein QJS66_14660 [Kocuria rhizophila]|nr:hypothetical protein QJS66_14660 [Kocuria rhizophila]